MATETTATEVAHGAQEAAEAAGMPQLDFSTFPNQIFWLVVALVVLYLLLSRMALPRIGSVIAERAGTITNRRLHRGVQSLRQPVQAGEIFQRGAICLCTAFMGAILATERTNRERSILPVRPAPRHQ